MEKKQDWREDLLEKLIIGIIGGVVGSGLTLLGPTDGSN